MSQPARRKSRRRKRSLRSTPASGPTRCPPRTGIMPSLPIRRSSGRHGRRPAISPRLGRASRHPPLRNPSTMCVWSSGRPQGAQRRWPVPERLWCRAPSATETRDTPKAGLIADASRALCGTIYEDRARRRHGLPGDHRGKGSFTEGAVRSRVWRAILAGGAEQRRQSVKDAEDDNSAAGGGAAVAGEIADVIRRRRGLGFALRRARRLLLWRRACPRRSVGSACPTAALRWRR